MKQNITKKIVYSATAVTLLAGSAVSGIGSVANAQEGGDLKSLTKIL